MAGMWEGREEAESPARGPTHGSEMWCIVTRGPRRRTLAGWIRSEAHRGRPTLSSGVGPMDSSAKEACSRHRIGSASHHVHVEKRDFVLGLSRKIWRRGQWRADTPGDREPSNPPGVLQREHPRSTLLLTGMVSIGRPHGDPPYRAYQVFGSLSCNDHVRKTSGTLSVCCRLCLFPEQPWLLLLLLLLSTVVPAPC